MQNLFEAATRLVSCSGARCVWKGEKRLPIRIVTRHVSPGYKIPSYAADSRGLDPVYIGSDRLGAICCVSYPDGRGDWAGIQEGIVEDGHTHMLRNAFNMLSDTETEALVSPLS